MTTRTRFKRSEAARRGAFTLIELLVVIAIIAALMALSASAVMKFVTVQQNNNTQSTLDRTQGELNKAWSKVKNAANNDAIPAGVLGLAGTDPNAAKRARVIYIKLKLRQAFPMNFDEALNRATANTGNQVSPLGALPAYATYLTSMGIGGSSVPPAPYESSVCLLMALQRGVSGAGINQEDLNKGGATGSINGLPYLTDAWGQPIYFTRVPSGSYYLNPNGAQASIATVPSWDPGDPQGLLLNQTWQAQSGGMYSALTLEPLAGVMSYKFAPMLGSSGQDKTAEFNTITFAPNLSADDLFSKP